MTAIIQGNIVGYQRNRPIYSVSRFGAVQKQKKTFEVFYFSHLTSQLLEKDEIEDSIVSPHTKAPRRCVDWWIDGARKLKNRKAFPKP